jgi:integrase/recombinase XerD
MLAERGCAKNTLTAYKNDLQQLTDFVENKKVQEITTDDLKRYLVNLYDKKSSSATMARNISCFKQFFIFLQLENVIKTNPAEPLELPKKQETMPQYLLEKEMEGLLLEAEKDTSPYGIQFYTMLELKV